MQSKPLSLSLDVRTQRIVYTHKIRRVIGQDFVRVGSDGGSEERGRRMRPSR